MIFANNLHTLHPSPTELERPTAWRTPGPLYRLFETHLPQAILSGGKPNRAGLLHGATYRVAPETFAELGAEVSTLFDEPDGKNINLHCGSQHPEALAQEVLKTKADVGFAFDGDGDRLIAVDETGTVLTGDQVMAICANVMKKEGRPRQQPRRPNRYEQHRTQRRPAVAPDRLPHDEGGRPICPRGDAGPGAAIGGEDSGHLIFLQHHTTGDGIITALQVAAAMKKEGKPLSELAKIMKVFPQALINVNVKSRPEITTVPEIIAVIQEVERKLGDQGRVLVRYSGTQNMCRVMVEGPSQDETGRYCRQIAEVVEKKLNT